MTCGEARDEILPTLYGEIEEDRRLRAEAHLEGCDACRLRLAEERRLVAILALRAEAGPPDDLLERCRRDLAIALRREAGAAAPERGAGRPATNGAGSIWPRLRISPALAVSMLVAGFLAGWLAPWRPPLSAYGSAAGSPGEGGGRTLAGGAVPDDAEAGAAGLRSLAFAPGGRSLRLTYETPGRSSLEGAPADPAVRRALLQTVSRSPNAGLRLDALEALKSQAADKEVRAALLGVMLRDANVGARLKAIDALQGPAGADAVVRQGIMEVLLRDRNPGVRVRAVDVLAGARGPETLPLLRRLARDDVNGYVRLRSAAALEAAYRPGDGGDR